MSRNARPAAIVAAIRAARTIAIATHRNPDADGIGSALALAQALSTAGVRIELCCCDPVPRSCAFLPQAGSIRHLPDEARARRLPPVDLLIACDCGDQDRLGAVAARPHHRLLNIDHHASNPRFGDLVLVKPVACTAMLIEGLLKPLRAPLNQAIATCLYAGLVYDTGRFLHANTCPATLRCAARLLATGIDGAAIARRLTCTRSRHDLRLQALAIDHLIIDRRDPRLAGIALDRQAISAVGRPDDWGDLIDVARDLEGVAIAYLLREESDGRNCRCSLRCAAPFDVAAVAATWGGGGHRLAAGCTIPGDCATAHRALRRHLRKAMDTA